MIKQRIPIIKLPKNPSLYTDDNVIGKQTFIKGEFNVNDVAFRVKHYVLTQTKLKRSWKWEHFAGLYEGLKDSDYKDAIMTSLGKLVRLKGTKNKDVLKFFYEMFDKLRKNKRL
jgi:hypothetical protein